MHSEITSEAIFGTTLSVLSVCYLYIHIKVIAHTNNWTLTFISFSLPRHQSVPLTRRGNSGSLPRTPHHLHAPPVQFLFHKWLFVTRVSQYSHYAPNRLLGGSGWLRNLERRVQSLARKAHPKFLGCHDHFRSKCLYWIKKTAETVRKDSGTNAEKLRELCRRLRDHCGKTVGTAVTVWRDCGI